jgi:cholest-4-en-3-one 26-monooxygenase
MTAVDFIDPLELVDAARYGQRGYPHDVWTRLRAEAPVAYFDPPGFEPFWAITKHADIQQVAAQPTRFSSAQGITLLRSGEPVIPMDMVVTIDPPRHGPLRRVLMRRFTPRGVRAERGNVERIAAELLDEVAASGPVGELDFVERIAAPLPLRVIASTLGVPRADVGLLYRWTNEIIGKDDPHYRQPGETPVQTMLRARGELHRYFGALLDERRAAPGDDLVSVLLAAEVDGQPLTQKELVSYCELLVEAGNETTRNGISGGLLAFAENPGEWEKLRSKPDLLPDAVEEVLRWSSPISHFKRLTTQDTEVRGTTIHAGDQVALYFASANRDEDVFADPFAFRVDRHPNPHIAFGFGEHFCMGAHLARLEIEAVYRLLVERVESFEVCGPVTRLDAIINGSITQLPISYRLTGLRRTP